MMVTYSCIVSDPPWGFRDNLPGNGRGAAKHYQTLSIGEICALHDRIFAAPDSEFPAAPASWLFLWRVAAMQAEALRVVQAAGYEIKSELVWVKPRIGLGRYVRNQHETCLICVRGPRPSQLRLSAAVPSVFCAPRGRHSEKPAEFYSIVERLCAGPRLELFARARRPGWECWGNEISAACEAAK